MAESIEKIKEMIDQGQLTEADKAIEELLELGPNNIEALKLKAIVFSQRGYFNAEHYTWCKIMEIAPDDLDVIDYFNFYYLEEKEKFYFTDRMPEGGRRFLLYPKMLFEACGAAFFSCLLFLIIHQSLNNTVFGQFSLISYLLLAALVVLPWYFIVRAFLLMPGDLRVLHDGIWITNRFRKKLIPWHDLEKIYVAHKSTKSAFQLSLVLMPHEQKKQIIEIEISLDNSLVKGRRFLIHEILGFYPKIEYIQRDEINLPDSDKIFSF